MREVILRFWYLKCYTLQVLLSKIYYSAFKTDILQDACTYSYCEAFSKTSDNLLSRMSKLGGTITVARTLTEIYDSLFKHTGNFKILQKSLLTL